MRGGRERKHVDKNEPGRSAFFFSFLPFRIAASKSSRAAPALGLPLAAAMLIFRPRSSPPAPAEPSASPAAGAASCRSDMPVPPLANAARRLSRAGAGGGPLPVESAGAAAATAGAGAARDGVAGGCAAATSAAAATGSRDGAGGGADFLGGGARCGGRLCVRGWAGAGVAATVVLWPKFLREVVAARALACCALMFAAATAA